jgi:hypothetical protein
MPDARACAYHDDRSVSLYEALSLAVSAVSTLATVYIGLRQLRSRAPSPAPSPVAPGGSGLPDPQPWPAPAHRPALVTAASLLLYAAAVVQPVVFVLYYGIRYAVDPVTVGHDFGDEGYIDVLGLGAIALVSALLGLNIARGSRTARVLVWMLAFASGAFLILLCAATLLASLAPDQSELGGAFQLLFFGYVALVCATYVVGGCLLVPASARAHFR